jgi:hypothetical protein
MPSIQAKDNSFKPLPAGDYHLIIEQAKETTSKKGDPMIKVTFGVEGQNSKVFANLVFNEACAGIITNFYRALGNEVEEGAPVDFEASDIIGHEVDAKLRIGQFEGKDKNEVAFYYELTDDEKNSKVKDVEPSDIPF